LFDPGNPQAGIQIEVEQGHTVFMQGALLYKNPQPGVFFIEFELAAIPPTNPITGEPNHNLLLNALPTKGNKVRFYRWNASISQWEIVFNNDLNLDVIGFLNTFTYGDIVTKEIMRLGQPVDALFVDTTFRRWKERAAVIYSSSIKPLDVLRLHGECELKHPNTVYISNFEEAKKLIYVSEGDRIRGPGLAEDVVVVGISSDSITLSRNSLSFGEFEYTVAVRSSKIVKDVQPLDYRETLNLTHPEDTKTIFNRIWEEYPTVSRAYIEGLLDSSLFDVDKDVYVVPPGIDFTDVVFSKDLFVEISLDRLLLHQNYVDFKLTGVPTSLMDLSWLEFIENFISKSKRATENVYVGSQLTLVTDDTGRINPFPSMRFSDPSIKSKFMVFVDEWRANNTAASVIIGQGGWSPEKQGLFPNLLAEDHEPTYGDTPYDENQDMPDWEDAENYLTLRGRYMDPNTLEALSEEEQEELQLVDRYIERGLFEVPLGEYEFIPHYNMDDNVLNRFAVIQTSIYPETFRNIEIVDEAYIVNNLFINYGERFDFNGDAEYLGVWNPTIDPANNTELDWPDVPENFDPTEFKTYYYIIPSTGDLLNYKFNYGDWVVYMQDIDNPGVWYWHIRHWLLIGAWPEISGGGIIPFPSHNQVLDRLISIFGDPGSSDWWDTDDLGEVLKDYYITYAIKDATLMQGPRDEFGDITTIQAEKNWWAVLTYEQYVTSGVIEAFGPVDNTFIDPNTGLPTEESEILAHNSGTAGVEPTPIGIETYQIWYLEDARVYDIAKRSLYLEIEPGYVLPIEVYSKLRDLRINLMDQLTYFLRLPRKFLAVGDNKFTFKIDPEFKTLDVNNQEYNLTESPIYYDEDENLYYVLNKNNVQGYDRHYVKFSEPSYFKNLLPIQGEVFEDNPRRITYNPRLGFPYKYLTLDDISLTYQRLLLRFLFDINNENKYYSHYIEVKGQVDATGTIITPITGTLNDDMYDREFRIAAEGLTTGDPLKFYNDLLSRQYDDRFENKYFKNLFVGLFRIYQSNPTVLTPVSAAPDSQAAFDSALDNLQINDSTYALYNPTGSSQYPPINIFDPYEDIRHLNMGPGVFIALGTNGKIAVSLEPETTWENKTVNNSTNPNYNYACYEFTEDTWYVVGDGGSVATSLDGGDTWEDESGFVNWGTENILVIEGSNPYEDPNLPNYLLMGGTNAHLAYFNVDEDPTTRQWRDIVLPISVDDPSFTAADVPPEAFEDVNQDPVDPKVEEGWDDEDVTAIAYHNNVWLIGGTKGKLAKSEDLENTTSSVFEMITLPLEWDDADVVDIKYENDTWMIIGNTTNGTGKIAYSLDNLNWSMALLENDITLNFSKINDLDWRTGQWFVAGDNGTLYASEDGVSWNDQQFNLTTNNLLTMCAGNGRFLFGDTTNTLYSFSNNSRTIDSVIIGTIDRDNIEIGLNDEVITAADWKPNEESKLILLSFNTAGLVDNPYIGIPSSMIASYIDSQTDKLILPTVIPAEGPSESNGMYLPRMNPFLHEEYLEGGTVPNPDFIGDEGYPLYTEDYTLYEVDPETQQIDLFENRVEQKLHYVDAEGNYIDDDFNVISPAKYVQKVTTEAYGSYVTYTDPRIATYLPKYTTYKEWLESDDAITLGTDNHQAPGAIDSTVLTDTEASITLDTPLPVTDTQINIIVLPDNPISIPLSPVLRYEEQPNMINTGLASYMEDGQPRYDVAPLLNDRILLPTTEDGDFTASTNGYGDIVYSLNPVSYSPDHYVLDGTGQKLVTTRDGRDYYTIEDETITGVYFDPEGYGAAIGIDMTENLPWEVDPDAFYRKPNGEFYYLQNKRQDDVHLLQENGEMILDGSGDRILVPAPIELTYEDLLAKHGLQIAKDVYTFDSKVTAVDRNGQWFEIDTDLPFDVDETQIQVEMRMLTKASVPVIQDRENETDLITTISPKDLLMYDPDRVNYDNSLYPSKTDRPDLYEKDKYFLNRGGLPVLKSDASGSLLNKDDVIDASARISVPQPLYRLCQDWFRDDFFIPNQESNPYWQYVDIQDDLIQGTKDWEQKSDIFKPTKNKFKNELELVEEEKPYFYFLPGFDYTINSSGLIQYPGKFINYKQGFIKTVVVTNEYYSEEDYYPVFYGIDYVKDFPDELFNTETFQQTTFNTGSWSLNYTVNTTKNFADVWDKEAAIVAVTELSVLNTEGRPIAYATFPPIIYDSSKHHLSVNLFIKQGDIPDLLPSTN
jgi:hypothetical protein